MRWMHARPAHPTRRALIGAALGLIGALLVGAPSLISRCRAVAPRARSKRPLTSGRKIGSEPIVTTLLALAVARFGISEISRNTLLGALAVAVGSVLLGTDVFLLLKRWRVRRTISGR